MSSGSEGMENGRKPPKSYSLGNLLEYFHGESSGASPQRLLREEYERKQQEKREALRPSYSVGDLDRLVRCPYSGVRKNPNVPYEFRMPLNYPRFSRSSYDSMPEQQLDLLLEEYGIPPSEMGSLEQKREYAKGAFTFQQ